MRNYLLVLLLALQCFSLKAEENQYRTEYFENEAGFTKDDAGQKRELLELLLLRERVMNLNMDWHNDPMSDATIEKNINTFLSLKKEMDTLSDFAWRYGMLLLKKVENESVITGHNRFVVLKISDAFSVLSRKLSEVTSLYYPKNKRIVKSDRLLTHGNINDSKSHAMWLSAHLTMFDAFLKAYNGFFRNKQTRNMIKDLARAKEGKDVRLDEVAAVAKHTLSRNSRRWMQKALTSYAASRNIALNEYKDEDLLRLVTSIETNQSGVDLHNDVNFKIRYYRLGDGLGRLLSWVVDATSGLFGNIAGRFRFRKGHMYDHEEYKVELLKRLRPLDILMEKTPFALTDTFIPGHYGHAAIYLGTEAQLREIGMWNHSAIIPHQADIRNGKVIAEALRPGVWLNTLEEFLNIDELTLYRQPNVLENKDEAARIYERTLAQLGKAYDFNFDVNTLDKIVCSELIYHAFGTINWPVKYVLGRPTISPDNLAEVAYSQNGPISFILGNRAEERFVPDPVDKLDIAEKLSLVQLEDGNFGKETRRCRDVHQENGELRKVCYGRVEALIYKAPNESIYDNQIKAAQAL